MPPAGAQPLKPAAPTAAGKEANEYIPSFISKKPFYIDDDDNTDYLEHQRLQKAETTNLSAKWYDRGKKLGPAATKFRKGACENCGAMTHKTKECLSRPRAKGAKWTGKDIQADEVVQDVNLGWDAKRDRWNGYDPKEYKAVVDEYAQLEELKAKAAAKNKKDDDEDEAEDGDKYAEESEMGRKQATSSKQLRIREDTAKYLLNLDLESAKYDPKTRTMVDSGATQDTAAALVAEEGFMRASGDAGEFEKAQKYAWEQQEKAGDSKLHLQANPTMGEYQRKKEREEAERKKAEKAKMLEEKYGVSSAAMPSSMRDMALVENESYVEYDESGAIKGAPKVVKKSKYREDVLINNHTSVWGSWWSDFKWGYACCHSMMKNSYCTGEAGKAAFEEENRLRTGGNLIEEAQEQQQEAAKEMTWLEKDRAAREEQKPAASLNEPEKLAATKRKLEEMKEGVTDEDMEEYKRKRMAANDPMAQFLGKDELL